MAMTESDPPPVEILNPQGVAPFLLVCDHASNRIPVAWDDLGLEHDALESHIAWDIGAGALTRRLSALLDAPAVLAGYSRIFIDGNRPPDDPTSIPEVSDGITVAGNRDVDAAEAARRAEIALYPYHDAVERMLDERTGRTRDPALVCIHSFTPVFGGIARPWHAGVLWNRDERTARSLLERLRREEDLVVGNNEPYDGREIMGYTASRHGETRGLPHVIIEVRQNEIDTREKVEPWARRLAAALRAVLGSTP
jgi:predicted N-formylglutamate amidohydrolase